MPNKERGEVSFYSEFLGKDATLKFDFNSWCVLEGLTGKPTHQVLDEFVKGQLGMIGVRQLFLAGLVTSIDFDELPVDDQLKQTGEIIQYLGGFEKAGVILNEAIVAAFPEKKEGKEKKSKANAGTGTS